MSRSRILRSSALAALVLASTVSAASAQSTDAVERPADRRSIVTERHAAWGLYATSIFLGLGAIAPFTAGLIGLGTGDGIGGPPTTAEELQRAGFVGGMAAWGVSILIVPVAIALHVDAVSRGRALDAGAVTLGPGPGDAGLAISIALDGTSSRDPQPGW